MDKDVIRGFFDDCAPSWDAEMIRSDEIINLILDGAEVGEGRDILDVACGTGVLFPDYLARNVKSITGVDISQNMIDICSSKFSGDNISLICGDMEEMTIMKDFDCIMVYNAFPHFPNPEILIYNLSQMLKTGGTLTVAHGMSRAAIEKHHSGSAADVSVPLMSEDELAEMIGQYLEVTVKISDDRMYQVTGRRR